MSPAAPSARGVVRIGPEHAGILADFFRRSWDPDSTPERVRASLERSEEARPDGPGAAPPAFAFAREGKIIGYVATIPARFVIDETERSGHWLKGLFVLPEYRNGPVGYHLVRSAAEALGLLGALVVAAPARRLFEANGFEDVATAANFVWPLTGFRAAQRLSPDVVAPLLPLPSKVAGPTIAAARSFGLAGAAGSLARLGLRLRRGGAPDPSVTVRAGWDAWDSALVAPLWRKRRAAGYRGLVRDAAYFEWRYGRRRTKYIPLVAVGDAGAAALGVLRRPEPTREGRFRPLHLAWLTELLHDPGDPASRRAAGMVVRRAEALAEEEEGDLLLSSFAGTPERLALEENGHPRFGGTMHLLLRDPEARMAETGEEARPPGEWVATRGDADSDAVT